jgi:hypothetical protein
VALILVFAFSAFVDANPVSHLVTAERALMAGTWAAGQGGS